MEEEAPRTSGVSGFESAPNRFLFGFSSSSASARFSLVLVVYFPDEGSCARVVIRKKGRRKT